MHIMHISMHTVLASQYPYVLYESQHIYYSYESSIYAYSNNTPQEYAHSRVYYVEYQVVLQLVVCAQLVLIARVSILLASQQLVVVLSLSMHSTRALLVSVHMDTITSYALCVWYVCVRVFLRCFCLVNNSGGNERAGTTSAIVPGKPWKCRLLLDNVPEQLLYVLLGTFNKPYTATSSPLLRTLEYTSKVLSTSSYERVLKYLYLGYQLPYVYLYVNCQRKYYLR